MANPERAASVGERYFDEKLVVAACEAKIARLDKIRAEKVAEALAEIDARRTARAAWLTRYFGWLFNKIDPLPAERGDLDPLELREAETYGWQGYQLAETLLYWTRSGVDLLDEHKVALTPVQFLSIAKEYEALLAARKEKA